MADAPDARQDEIFRLLGALGFYWMAHPELRLGQIIGNMAGPGNHDAYYVEDEEMFKRIIKELK